jgi:zinc transport system substrate-binding protein
MPRLSALLAALLAISATACSDDGGADDGRLQVTAAFFPIEEVVRNVGDDIVDLAALVPPGSEAHEYEPTPKQLAELESADVVFYLAGFQPNLENAILGLPDSVEKVDLLDGITLLPDDPHVWLAPSNMRTMAATVAMTLERLDPANGEAYEANATRFTAALTSLDESFVAGLAECDTDVLVTGHEAFGYLADAYGLQQVAIAGISPGEEPSAQTLEDVAAIAEANDVTTIFFEENLPDDLARTVADEIGVRTAVLSTLETLSGDEADSGATYVSVMETNLTTLRESLGCR